MLSVTCFLGSRVMQRCTADTTAMPYDNTNLLVSFDMAQIDNMNSRRPGESSNLYPLCGVILGPDADDCVGGGEIC